MRTVELLPDEQLDSSIRRAWHLLVDSALPSQAQHTHVSNRPHVTLAVVDDWDEGTTDALASALSLLPVPLHSDGLRTFGQRRLSVVVSLALELELIAVHEAVHDVLEASAWGVEERHLPGRWAPHLTLGRGMDRTQERAARLLLGEQSWPDGQAIAARTYDTDSRSVRLLE
jgi:2'-5' RNA ligase